MSLNIFIMSIKMMIFFYTYSNKVLDLSAKNTCLVTIKNIHSIFKVKIKKLICYTPIFINKLSSTL